MITKKLVNESTLQDENGFEFSVGYFITKTSDSMNDSQSSYGIIIEKPLLNGESDLYSAEACFKKEDNALLLLKTLREYSVTPSAAEESIDILMGLCDFSY